MTRSDHAGEILDGRYRLVEKIGEGGMGSVYLGQHVVIGRQVAVKLLRVELTSSEHIVERFYREAHAAAAIKHKNVIDIFDLGLSPWGEPYLVMEYLKGESLGTMLARVGPLNVATACGVMEPMLAALEAAHKSGVIHRDLKPENIFLVHEEGEVPTVKLIDFGISKFAHEDEQMRLTQTGSLLGTPDFLSPEQARGDKAIDHRADIWSAGIILYECLTQSRPFRGNNYNDLIYNVMNEALKPPSKVHLDCPPEIDPILIRALEKEPSNRYQTAAEMADDLKKLEGYSKRNEKLIECTKNVSEVCFAAGDLGENTVTVPINFSAKVLDDLARDKTPKDWSLVGAKKESKFKNIFFGIVLLIAVGLAGTIFFLSFNGANSPKEPEVLPVRKTTPSQAEEVEEEPAGVQISLEGLPENAKIFYQDALVPLNPFRVDEGSTVVPLRVEAEGFETFHVMIVPSEDKTIELDLKKKEPSSKKGHGKPASGDEPEDSQLDQAMESVADLGSLAGGDANLLRAQQQLVYTKNKRFLKRCYDQALARGDAAEDEVLSIKLVLHLNSTGSVIDTSVSGSGATIPSLNECLKRETNKWSFPPNDENNSVEFDFAFTTN